VRLSLKFREWGGSNINQNREKVKNPSGEDKNQSSQPTEYDEKYRYFKKEQEGGPDQFKYYVGTNL